MQWSALEKCWPKLGLLFVTAGWNGSEPVHEGIRNVTLALLPPTQVGNGSRGAWPGKVGAWWPQTRERIDYPANDQLQVPMASGAPRSLVTGFLPQIVSCLKWSSPFQQVGISQAKCLSSSVSWWLRAGHWEGDVSGLPPSTATWLLSGLGQVAWPL